MAITLYSAPVNYAAAYKPVLWSFTSDYSPQNTLAGESGIAITEIRTATATDVANYGVNIGDVLMDFTPSPGVLFPYQQLTIYNTDNGYYDGLRRVRSVINDGLVILDVDWLGDDTNGKFDKTYERYTLIAEVSFSGITDPVTGAMVPVRYELKPDQFGRFTMDLQDAAQRGFKDILSNVDCRPGSHYGTVADGENYITQTYTVKVFHGYIVTNPRGSGLGRTPSGADFYFAEIRKGIEATFPPYVVVNAVQPDNHVDIDGTVDLSWQEDLKDYQANINTTGSGVKRFLTYGPRTGQKMGENDDAFLAFLFTGTPGVNLKLTIGTLDAAGATIAVTRQDFEAPLHSGVIAIGPRNLDGLITPETVAYSLAIANDDEFFITEIFRYVINRKCGEAYLRPQALNPLGGIDSIGMNIRERDGVSVDRAVMSKPNMEVTNNPFWTGDFNTRTWAIEMARTYGASSAPQSAVMRKWFFENIFPSPDVRIPINDSRWTPVIVTTKDAAIYTSEKKPEPIRFEFILGVDNIRQRR